MNLENSIKFESKYQDLVHSIDKISAESIRKKQEQFGKLDQLEVKTCTLCALHMKKDRIYLDC